MNSKFLREQKRYTQKELGRILECSEEELLPIIRKLKEYGVLKAVRSSDVQKNMSELRNEDIEVAEVDAYENTYYYVLTFVGVIAIAGRVLKCYPKYILNNSEPTLELKQIFKVLEKYNTKSEIVRMFNTSIDNQSFNLLAVLLFLLNDYYENGSYTNTEEIVESNGSGEILWDKTINETFTLLSNGKPYYTDLQTKKRVQDDYDFFKRMHESILTIASKELEDAKLLSLFDLSGIDLSDESLDEFGDKEYLLYRIEQELNTQFNTRKQLVLKAMYTYIDKGGHLSDIDCLSMFGTNSFNLVWEEVCRVIFGDKLRVGLSELPLPTSLKSGYNAENLLGLIEKPYWSITEKRATDTLIPDIVSFNESDGKHQFIIFDAKYYTPLLENGRIPSDHPGIESVTKQYLYQLAFQEFIRDHGFDTIKNCFLLPTEESAVVDKGYVELNILHKLDLENIQVRLIPAVTAYKNYLEGRKMKISELLLDC